MNVTLTRLANEFIAVSSREALLSLSEGLAKVRAIEAALRLGWTIQEGAGNTPQGPIADFARLTDSGIVWERGTRRIQLDAGSADLAVVDPFTMFLEIKCRPDVGTKSQAQFQEMLVDVVRVAESPLTGLLFVFDPKIYTSFSGEKTEMRGRPSSANSWFTSVFPRYDEVMSTGRVERSVVMGDTPMTLSFLPLVVDRAPTRIVAIGARNDASF